MSGRLPRWRRFETIGSVTAIVVGVAAIFVSTYQAHIMRNEIRASVWPALQITGFISADPEGTRIGARVSNVGVGPALIERITVKVEGDFIEDLPELITTAPEGANHSFELLRGRIMASGEAIDSFSFEYVGKSYDELWPTYQYYGEHMELEVCYCSSMKECWVRDLHSNPPQPVKSCATQPSSNL